MEKLLSRLNKCTSRGNGQYMACCPAHNDKNPSLSIKDNGDGRIILKCFAGCDTADVLNAIGLTFADILPEQPKFHRAKPVKQTIYAPDALRVIQFEARLIMLAAYDLKKGKPLPDDDIQRLELAISRINVALEAANVTA